MKLTQVTNDEGNPCVEWQADEFSGYARTKGDALNDAAKVLKSAIRDAKRNMNAQKRGTPEHEKALQSFWKLQGELGKVELESLCAS